MDTVILLHGFGQDRTCFGPLAEDLARDHRVVALDLPRHGQARAVGGTFEEDAAWLARAVPEPALWVGYSLGGRYALRVALDVPQRVRALVTIGATAGIDDPEVRARRREDDEALARALETEGCDAFFERWLRRPMFAGIPESSRFRAVRAAQDARALAAGLRAAGTAAMMPLWSRLSALSMPVTCLAGAHDVPFVAASRRIAAIIGANAEAVTIAGAGHAAHLEQPAEVIARVRAALGP